MPKYKKGDIVTHISDCNWHPYSSVNIVCEVVGIRRNPYTDVFLSYIIKPVSGENKDIFYVCGDDDLAGSKVTNETT